MMTHLFYFVKRANTPVLADIVTQSFFERRRDREFMHQLIVVGFTFVAYAAASHADT